MFDWFWRFLYSISKALFRICDGMMSVANMLLGIDDITVNGTSTDLLTYLITGDKVKFAFAACSILAIVLLFLFTMFAIVRSVIKEQPGISPAQICVKSFKTFLMFLFVPFIMITLTYFLNTFMRAVYQATMYGSSSIGAFLFIVFADDTSISEASKEKFVNGTWDYYNTGTVENAVGDLSDFNFIMSWITAGVVMYNIAGSLLLFVDRAISIMILYLAAPFSISASVIDDGAHFKTWREQVLTKYLSAFGTILAVNVYIMFVGLVTDSDVVFFTNSFFNYIAKILIVIGGAMSMRKAMALVAALMSQGGAAEINDPTNIKGRMLAGAAFKKAAGIATAPVRLPASFAAGAVKGAIDRKLGNVKDRMGNAALNKFGIDTSYDNKRLGLDDDNKEIVSGNKNNNQAEYEKNNQLKDALEGGNGDKKDSSNQNTNSPQGSKGNNVLNNALANSGSKNEGKKEE